MDTVFSPDGLWEAMKKADMNPGALADEMGCTVRTVTEWFNGVTPRPTTIKLLARVLGVHEADLMEEVE